MSIHCDLGMYYEHKHRVLIHRVIRFLSYEVQSVLGDASIDGQNKASIHR